LQSGHPNLTLFSTEQHLIGQYHIGVSKDATKNKLNLNAFLLRFKQCTSKPRHAQHILKSIHWTDSELDENRDRAARHDQNPLQGQYT
jgi:hypothetical protein